MSTALALREGVQRLEITMRVTIGVLALASGVYTYLGVRELLSGSPTLVFFAALVYSVAVSIGIYAFWSFLLRLAPHVRDQVGRGLLFVAMALGSLMIVAMSAWLNATALAGAAALEQHLATTLQSYSRDLDQAHRQALAAQGLLPDIQMASTQFSRLADAEGSGSLTGTSGSGTVVQLLSQMGTQLGGLAKEVADGSERVKALNDQGGKHLAKMREIVSGRGPILPRSDAFAGEATALLGVIASLQQTSVAPAVKRAADNLAKTFIAPSAGGRFGDLADRQTAVVGRVQEAVTAQAKALSAAADTIISQPAVEPTRFRAMSTAEAVLRYASDFLPSWAGAVSIDLLPAVLVIILCIVHAAIRREGMPEATAASMTASDLMTALRLAREVEEAKTAPRVVAVEETGPREEQVSLQPEASRAEIAEQPSRSDWKPEENVTPLSTARAGKKADLVGRFHIAARTLRALAARFARRRGSALAVSRHAGDYRHGTGDAGGRLNAVGTIGPGTAKTFADEIAKRGSYVKTIVLHSPGGSVADALEMGRLIRQKGFNTAVETGRYCASSCPLLFAGGVERYAGDKAVLGVHQVFSIPQIGVAASDGSEAVQRVAAECQRYLRDMGVDLEVWMRAMETPRDALYYFKHDELFSLKLATQNGDPRTPPPAVSSAKS